jgi:hypothetical protein
MKKLLLAAMALTAMSAAARLLRPEHRLRALQSPEIEHNFIHSYPS